MNSDHGLHGDGHPPQEAGAACLGLYVVGDLRGLVHPGPDAVAHVFPHHGEAFGLHVALNGSSHEIQLMRQAGKITAAARALAGAMVAPGVTTREIDKEVKRFIRSNGAEPSFLGTGRSSPRWA